MSDMTLTCRDCGQTFVFTAGEQAFYQERGFSEPQRCPACRAKRKADRGVSNGGHDGGSNGTSYSGTGNGSDSSGPRQMYAAICSNCGKQTEVPFLPRLERPVFCRECFTERREAAPRTYSNY